MKWSGALSSELTFFRGIAARRASTKRLAGLDKQRRKRPDDPVYGPTLVAAMGPSALVPSHNRDDGYRCGSPLLDSERLEISDLNVLRRSSQLEPCT